MNVLAVDLVSWVPLSPFGWDVLAVVLAVVTGLVVGWFCWEHASGLLIWPTSGARARSIARHPAGSGRLVAEHSASRADQPRTPLARRLAAYEARHATDRTGGGAAVRYYDPPTLERLAPVVPLRPGLDHAERLAESFGTSARTRRYITTPDGTGPDGRHRIIWKGGDLR